MNKEEVPELGDIDVTESNLIPAESAKDFLDTTSKLLDDPMEKIDSQIEKTAKTYLDEIISNIEFIPRRKSPKELIYSIMVTTVGLTVVLASVVGLAFAISHLPLRSHFLGIDTSHTQPQVAYEKIQQEINKVINTPVLVSADSDTFELTPSDVGISLDLVETINNTPKNPIATSFSLIAPYSIKPVIEIDQTKMQSALNSIAQRGEVIPKVADVSIENSEVIVSRQINGRTINWLKTKAQIEENWLINSNPIQLIYDSIEPDITDEEVAQVAAEIEQILTEPVTVKFFDQSATFNRDEIAQAIYLEKSSGEITLDFNPYILWSELVSKFGRINEPAQDARIEIVNDQPQIIDANYSISLNRLEFKELFLNALSASQERLLDLSEFATAPEVTTEEIKTLGIVEKVSEFRQWFPPAQYRTDNVGTAASYIDGTILLPGEIYSMNQTIKERTKENGYVEGIYISNGRFEEGYGGGVSIITTAVWTTAFFAGLEAIEQRAHSIYIPRYQEGIEATVQWGSLDLKFKNTLDSAILIKTKVDLDGVTIQMFGKKKYDQVIAKKTNRYNIRPFKTVYSEAKSCIAQDGQPGFGVTVTRELMNNGLVVKSDQFKTNYRVGNEVICGPNPNKKIPEPEPPLPAEVITAAE